MLEQALINPNFAGRDGFRWFIGVTANTDPDRAKNEYGYRVQVRIVGHHPGDEIDDKDLPWAQVLVPLNMGSGAGGSGVSMNTRGGEWVFGFYADGDDGQQPIVIGALYGGTKTEYKNTFNQGTKYFKSFQQKPGAIVNPSNIPVIAGAAGTASAGIPKTPGTIGGDPTVAETVLGQGKRVGIPGHCKENKDIVSQINRGLNDFIKVMGEVQYVNDTYIQPVLNRIVNIDAEIDRIATVISDALTVLVKYIRDEIITGIYNLLRDFIASVTLSKWAEFLKKAAAGEIADGIWCLFLNILKKIKKFVFDFLFGMIGKVSSIPICLVETFTGSIIQSVANEITDAIGPSLDQISSTLGGGIGTVMSYVDKAINVTKGIANFLQCEDSPCKETFDYEMNKGFVDKGGDLKFQQIINYSPAKGLENLLDNGLDQAEGFLGGISNGDGLPEDISQYFGGCDFNLSCGMPQVKIFGGGGSGATGNSVVDAFGQIMGVNITNPGSGYTSEPYVRFEDDCENGSGAYGYAVIKNGEVDRIVMESTGSDYLGPDTSEVDEDVDDEELIKSACSIPPSESSGTIVYPYILEVIIVNTGIGYSVTDVGINSQCPDSDVELNFELDPEGRITKVNIINPGTSINIFPEITINTSTGSGAVLIPVLGFNQVPVETAKNLGQIKTVVYCGNEV